MLYEITVGEDSESWVKVTVPVTVESPRRMATSYDVFPSATHRSIGGIFYTSFDHFD